jgi:hypothetical protein
MKPLTRNEIEHLLNILEREGIWTYPRTLKKKLRQMLKAMKGTK